MSAPANGHSPDAVSEPNLAATSRDAVIAADDIGVTRLDPNGTADDPAWLTEQLTQTIDRQLLSLTKLLEQAPSLPDGLGDVQGWVSPNFTCSQLRPTETELHQLAGGVHVHRPRTAVATTVAASAAATSEFNGGAGFVAALRQWCAPLSEASHCHGKFKVFGIQVTGRTADVTLHFHFDGETSTDQVEQNAIWQTRWSLDDDSVRLLSVADPTYERTIAPRVTFADCTRAAFANEPVFDQQLVHGLDHWLDRLERGMGIIPTAYTGLAVGDANGDGLDDLFVAQPGGVLTGLPNRLLLQQPDGTLRDVSRAAGLDWTTETHSALWLDLDNDGDQDLVVATVMGVVFLENTGNATFARRAVQLCPEAPPISLAAADFDQDGDLDVYACCYSQRSSSEMMGRPVPYHDANNGGRNALFRNDQSWSFTNVTVRSGLDQNNRRFSFAAAWEDYDNDGDLDLYVANDYGRNNLYENHQGKFRDVAAAAGVEDISAGMSVTWGDSNHDGWMDLYVSNMWSSAGNRIAYQRHFQPNADPQLRQQLQRHARGNSLFQNTARGAQRVFNDVSEASAVMMGRWAWSSNFVDLNTDGWEDLVVTNGFITQEDNRDL